MTKAELERDLKYYKEFAEAADDIFTFLLKRAKMDAETEFALGRKTIQRIRQLRQAPKPTVEEHREKNGIPFEDD